MVTGHRELAAEEADWVRGRLADCVAWLRDVHDTTVAISGMALGVDTTWAQVALDAGLALHAYVPFPQQPDRWPEPDREEWSKLLARATEAHTVGDLNNVDPGRRRFEVIRLLHARNDAMLRATSGVAVAALRASATTGGTYSCVEKARRRGLTVVHIEPESRTTRLLRPEAASL
jgi:hypothetical protein